MIRHISRLIFIIPVKRSNHNLSSFFDYSLGSGSLKALILKYLVLERRKYELMQPFELAVQLFQMDLSTIATEDNFKNVERLWLLLIIEADVMVFRNYFCFVIVNLKLV